MSGSSNANGDSMNVRLGIRVLHERRRVGMSQGELGKRLTPAVSHVAISDIERGRVGVDLDRIADIARVLGVPATRLIPWEEAYCPCCGQEVGP